MQNLQHELRDCLRFLCKDEVFSLVNSSESEIANIVRMSCLNFQISLHAFKNPHPDFVKWGRGLCTGGTLRYVRLPGAMLAFIGHTYEHPKVGC